MTGRHQAQKKKEKFVIEIEQNVSNEFRSGDEEYSAVTLSRRTEEGDMWTSKR